jgi:Rrf2 family protein
LTGRVQHILQISRKIDYALRALIYLASRPEGQIAPLQEIARALRLPREFLAKILKTLTASDLVRSVRGSRGGYVLARGPAEISFLDAIEAAGGPVQINVCLERGDRCQASPGCSMLDVWRTGQDRMLDVYRSTSLAELARHPSASALVPLKVGGARVRGTAGQGVMD